MVMNILKENTPSSLDEIRKNYIYEDLMVALILYKFEIYPQKTELIIKGDKLSCIEITLYLHFLILEINLKWEFIKKRSFETPISKKINLNFYYYFR